MCVSFCLECICESVYMPVSVWVWMSASVCPGMGVASSMCLPAWVSVCDVCAPALFFVLWCDWGLCVSVSWWVSACLRTLSLSALGHCEELTLSGRLDMCCCLGLGFALPVSREGTVGRKQRRK